MGVGVWGAKGLDGAASRRSSKRRSKVRALSLSIHLGADTTWLLLTGSAALASSVLVAAAASPAGGACRLKRTRGKYI